LTAFGPFGSVSGRLLGSKPGQWWTISLRPARSGYLGAVALAVFVAITGINLDAVFSGESRSTVSGWPLILLIGGGALVVLSFVLRPGALDEVQIVRAPDEPT
jgi:hypothetical protein